MLTWQILEHPASDICTEGHRHLWVTPLTAQRAAKDTQACQPLCLCDKHLRKLDKRRQALFWFQCMVCWLLCFEPQGRQPSQQGVHSTERRQLEKEEGTIPLRLYYKTFLNINGPKEESQRTRKCLGTNKPSTCRSRAKRDTHSYNYPDKKTSSKQPNFIL